MNMLSLGPESLEGGWAHIWMDLPQPGPKGGGEQRAELPDGQLLLWLAEKDACPITLPGLGGEHLQWVVRHHWVLEIGQTWITWISRPALLPTGWVPLDQSFNGLKPPKWGCFNVFDLTGSQ